MPHDANTRRVQLGAKLKEARLAKGWPQSQAAAAMRCTQSKINKIENDRVAIGTTDLERMLLLYELSGVEAEEIRLLAMQARGGGPRAGAPANRDYVKLLDLERRASRVFSYHAERLPNLFQSERYTLKQYALADALHDTTAVLDSRQEREELFQIERPPHYRAIFSPSSLYRLPGGRSADLARDQIQHLLTMMATYHRHLFVHLLPWEAPLAITPHDLTILEFDKRATDEQDAVYHEYAGGRSRIYTGKQQVKEHISLWNTVFEHALGVDETRAALLKMLDEASYW
ncbi:helix-turn-helix transcriptional regulator [Amycolatopsis sp. NPDC089917]|uniref:helix-turn-helix domain-containing protein n=1 Tax=Amycolatopsis sp. NPDC089917 TaxID=3155187 RepID=UPI00342339D0